MSRATGVPVTPWSDPELVGWRREPMTTRRPTSYDDRVLLDGVWRLQVLASPDAEPGPEWGTGRVPGCWPLEDDAVTGAGRRGLPWYTNSQMPWDELPPVPPTDNPTAVYERTVSRPAGWGDGSVILHVGAAESLLLVHLDGECVGLSTDSHLAAEFDLTDHLADDAEHVLRLTVVTWSAGTFVEDQDQWWLGGVTRSVWLYRRPRLHLQDVRAVAGLAADDGTGSARGVLALDVRVADAGGRLPDGWRVAVTLDGEPAVFDADAHERDREHERLSVYHGRARFHLEVADVVPWSPDTPVLHELVVELRDTAGDLLDRDVQRVGFRTVAVRGADLLLNGVRLPVRGVNRHDRDARWGRVVTPDVARAELETVKRLGFNAIRAAHYPNDPVVLDLTDELGLLVVDEADLESHAYAHELASDTSYLPTFLERVARMVRRDRNHPSVVLWSLGNESDYGPHHDAMAAWVRHEDPTRPVQYEPAIQDDYQGGRAASDLVCPMYPSVETIVEHVTSAPPDRPVVLCEFAHAMGNAGGLEDYVAAFERYPGLQGGFVWELADHGLLQRLTDGLPAGPDGPQLRGDGRAPEGHRFAYGGDFGEPRHDGAFVHDGILHSDLAPKPLALEHRELVGPVRLRVGEDGRVVLRNAQPARDLAWLTGEWQGHRLDGTVTRAPAVLPSAGPGEEAVVDVPVEVLDGAATLVLALAVGREQPWAPVGTPLALPWVAVGPTVLALPGPQDALDPQDPEDGVDGVDEVPAPALVRSGPEATLWRAPTDNDIGAGNDRRWEGRRTPPPSRRSWARHTLPGVGDGWLVREHVEVAPDDEGSYDVPRVGVRLEVDLREARATWFGHGPWKTYPDRRAAPLGVHEADVEELVTGYSRPQESGGRAGVRWLRLEGTGPDAGHGLVVALTEPGQVQVSRWTPDEVAAAAHPDRLPPSDRLVLHVDHAHRGLGSAACGPDAAPRHRLSAASYDWTWWLRTW